MTTFTEAAHPCEFMLSEANGSRSREVAEIAAGQTLVAGQVVQDDGNGQLTAFTGLLDTAGALITQAKGVVLYPGTSSTATDDVVVSYVARDAEVNGNLVTFPTETTGGDERDNAIASLKLLGIVVRD